MHIIVVSSGLAKARSVSLSGGQLLAAALGVSFAVAMMSIVMVYATVRYAAELRLPFLESMIATVQARQSEKTESFLRQNLDAMAVKLGEMQAQLARLDALGERVSALAGLKPAEFRFNETPGRGGALPESFPPRELSMVELGREVDALSRRLDNRADSLGILETALFDARIRKKLLPTIAPVDAAWSASSFGWRIDPFTGQNAMHEGVDFMADVGTPVFAAAGGVVVFAGLHPQYGNMVEIDHGNEFVTRYAHASRLLVKAGDLVQRGRKIAEVGSTGRSTGPHLHFEVRYRNTAQNPANFLRASRT
jgi:murein DD-endopeptidase MepM/ murein hydrolase activator NlpD